MLSANVVLLTAGITLAAFLDPLIGAEPSTPAKPPGAIIITNATNGSAAQGRTPYLSAGLPDIVKMHKAGVDASVLMAYVRNAPVAYHPSAKEIIYLRDQGLSSELISAMLQRGGELRDRAAEAQREERSRATPPPAAPPAAPAPASPSPSPAAAAPVVVYANTPYPVYPTYVNYAYSYASPAYYNYGYCRPYYRSSYYPSYYGGYSSGCYPRYGLSVGYSSGCYPRYGLSVGFRGGYGYGGGYRYARGGYCRR